MSDFTIQDWKKMIRFLLFFSLLIHSTCAKKSAKEPPKAPPVAWQTLDGGEPLVIARGGFSGLFPESSQMANDAATSNSLTGLTLYCNLQLSKDGVGFCLSDIRLENSTTIQATFPKGEKTYNVYGENLHGWFAMDYSSDDLFNLSLVQPILSRTSLFDNSMPIPTVEDVIGLKPAQFWLNVEMDMFYNTHKLSPAAYVEETLKFISYISSPEINFLKAMSGKVGKKGPKLILRFKGADAIEPTTKKPYSSLLKDLASIKSYASGILVPKEYIWPVTKGMYLEDATTLVTDAHKAGLEVHAYGFANDQPIFLQLHQPLLVRLYIPPYLASNKGLSITDAVASALSNATLDKQSTQQVLIRSDDSSVLSKFKDVPTYKRVLNIEKVVGDAPQKPVEEIKKFADAVTITRASVIKTTSDAFTSGNTTVVKELHAANISVYVGILRNEFTTIAFDLFSDPMVEIATYRVGFQVDGIITEYPGTAAAYLRSPCSDMNDDNGYKILPAETGALLPIAAQESRAPAEAPASPLDVADVVDPPLPPVKNASTSPPAPVPEAPHSSSGSLNVINMVLSFAAISVLCILSLGITH